MSEHKTPRLTFSQREGLEPPPPQLAVGVVSQHLRQLLWEAVFEDLNAKRDYGPSGWGHNPKWERVSRKVNVRFFGRAADEVKGGYEFEQGAKQIFLTAKIGPLFDFVEFLLQSPDVDDRLKAGLASALEEARAAYRIIDGQVCRLGSAEEAETFQRATDAASAAGAVGARAHLVAAAHELRNGNWAASVRDSIHAVEATCSQMVPGANKLEHALLDLKNRGQLPGGLKAAFAALYGWSSDEEGVRHALVFQDVSNVTESDAVFMLGACAAFVSYLIAKGGPRGAA